MKSSGASLAAWVAEVARYPGEDAEFSFLLFL